VSDWNESIGAAIESAAGALPEDYKLRIMIERHGYSVRLILPDETVCDVDRESLADEIESLVELAISFDSKEHAKDE
jgi:hypothetical protein